MRKTLDRKASQEYPDAKRLLGALANSRGNRHEENAARLVKAALEMPREVGAALLATAEGYTPRATKLLDDAREQLGSIEEIAGALADDLPAPKTGPTRTRRRRRRRKKGPGEGATETTGTETRRRGRAVDERHRPERLRQPTAPARSRAEAPPPAPQAGLSRLGRPSRQRRRPSPNSQAAAAEAAPDNCGRSVTVTVPGHVSVGLGRWDSRLSTVTGDTCRRPRPRRTFCG